MCGINGFTWHDPDALRRMHAATRHRGPDDEGFFEAPGISFAHNRLSIIDLSPGGHQPMTTPDERFTIVFNGEIYNYRELRRELEALGETFSSQSDTEALVRAFARWGVDGLRKLNGIFAFAVWDRDEQSLTLVRDQIGIKPVYYHFDGKHLSFSSEIKALLELGVPRVLDREALDLYFRLLYVPGPRTMFREVKKLMPGHALVFKDGNVLTRQWWKLEQGSPVRTYGEAVSGVRERVRTAVQRQLVSDRPLGVFLSGGIDSTSVLAMMRELDPSGAIKTFSVGYERTDEAEKYNADARLARESARHFGTEHHELTMTSQDVLETLESSAWHMDEPVSNHVQTSTYLLAKFAQPTITVALGGDGGDELFGGYPRYWYSRMIDLVRRVPLARPSLGLILGEEFARKAATEPGLERHLSFVMQKEETVRSFLKTHGGTDAVRSALRPAFDDAWRDETNRLMAADVQTWLPDESLIRTDKLTMAHGLEERVPLLDVDLVEFAMRIPSRFKIGARSQGKRVFIDALRSSLPPHVLREEKRAWMSPAAKWIRGPLLPLVREVLSPAFNPDTAALFDFARLQTVLDDHLSKRAYGLNTLWSILTFQLWYRRYFNQAV